MRSYYNQPKMIAVDAGKKPPLCHFERSEKSRPTAPKYHLSFSHNVPWEGGNISVEDEISHCVRNDRVELMCSFPIATMCKVNS
jgi:hypothetical protein